MRNLTELVRALVDADVLSSGQAQQLMRAADADLANAMAGQQSDRLVGTATAGPAGQGNAVLEVLGYVGATLLLGAVGVLGVLLWDEMTGLQRKTVAIVAMLIPLAAGPVVVRTRVRKHLGEVLLALACYAAGFIWFTLHGDETGYGTGTVMLVCSLAGAAVLRHGAFLVSGATGASIVILAFANNPVDSGYGWLRIAVGFLILAMLLAGAGFLIARALAWSLAGLAGWASAWAWLGLESGGDWVCLLAGTVAAAGLFLGFVRSGGYGPAVIGCLIVLSVWPSCLYQIVGSALGVAVGLIAAGAVLIVLVIVLSRLRSTAHPS